MSASGHSGPIVLLCWGCSQKYRYPGFWTWCHTLFNPLHTNRFFLLGWYNKLGIIHCTIYPAPPNLDWQKTEYKNTSFEHVFDSMCNFVKTHQRLRCLHCQSSAYMWFTMASLYIYKCSSVCTSAKVSLSHRHSTKILFAWSNGDLCAVNTSIECYDEFALLPEP